MAPESLEALAQSPIDRRRAIHLKGIVASRRDSSFHLFESWVAGKVGSLALHLRTVRSENWTCMLA